VLYRWLQMPLVAASAVAVELAVVSNYLLNDRWTFAAGSPRLRRFAKFNVSSLGGLAVNVLSVWFLARIGVHVLVANLAGIAAGFAVNLALSGTWVWGQRA
jgi:putative flippase GtrA